MKRVDKTYLVALLGAKRAEKYLQRHERRQQREKAAERRSKRLKDKRLGKTNRRGPMGTSVMAGR